MANGQFGGGNGTVESPYLVEDAHDLNAVSLNPKKHFIQTKNIDMAVYDNFTPIPDFNGSYNGQRYEIKNLKINRAVTNTGLFSIISNTSRLVTIHLLNINLVNVDIVGLDRTGGLVGCLDARDGNILIIKGCSVSGSVKGTDNVGGLVGYASNNFYTSSCKHDIMDCYTSCSVSGLSSVGGFAGHSSVSAKGQIFKNCYSSGNVKGSSIVGGFVGSFNFNISVASGLVSLCKVITKTATSTSPDFGTFQGNDAIFPGTYAISTTEFVQESGGA